MPAAVAVPLIVSAVGAGTTVAASRSAGRSARRSQDIQSKSDDAALQYERERDAEAKRQWDAQQAFEAQKYAAQEEQRLHDRQLADAAEARRAPYRAASQAALQSLAQRLGLKFDMPAPSAPMGGGGRTTTNGLPGGHQNRSPMADAYDTGPYAWGQGGSPMTGGAPMPFPGAMSVAGQSPSRQLSYDPNAAMTAGQLLKLQPRRRLI